LIKILPEFAPPLRINLMRSCWDKFMFI